MSKLTPMPDGSGILVLGIGNVLMGDEGVGVNVVRELEMMGPGHGVTYLDGGTGGLQLLGPMQRADRVMLIDATADGRTVGSVQRLEPRFSSDYPRTLTGHDIGLKDLLDALHLLGNGPKVTLFAISIDPPRDLAYGLTEELAALVPQIATRIRSEIRDCSGRRVEATGART